MNGKRLMDGNLGNNGGAQSLGDWESDWMKWKRTKSENYLR